MIGTAPYGSVSAGREFWPFRVIFFQKVERSCGQTVKDRFDFSIDSGQLYLVHSGDLNLALDNKEEEEEGGNNDEEKEEDKTNNIQNIQIRSILFSTGEPCKDRLILTAIPCREHPPSEQTQKILFNFFFKMTKRGMLNGTPKKFPKISKNFSRVNKIQLTRIN